MALERGALLRAAVCSRGRRRLRALAVTSDARTEALPAVPTMVESGFDAVRVTTWYGIWAPKGTPADAQAHMVEEVRRACQTDEAKAMWAGQGAEFPNLTGPQFDGFIKKELAKWSQVVKASGAKLD